MEEKTGFEAWKDSFSSLPDPRVACRTGHRLLDIVFLTLCPSPKGEIVYIDGKTARVNEDRQRCT